MVIKKIFKFLKNRNKKNKPKKKKVINKKSKKKRKIIKSKSVIKREKLIAVAIHYFSKIKVVVLKMKGSLKIKDKIRIKGFTTDYKQTVSSMQINHKPINIAKKGQEIGLMVRGKVRHGDKVYKI